MKFPGLRFIASVTLFFFTSTQIIHASEWQQVQSSRYQSVENYNPLSNPGETDPIEPDQGLTTGAGTASLQDSSAFLSDTLTLSEPDEEPAHLDYEYERYEFEEALDLLRPEYASAVIVKNLTTENLKDLLDLPFETGILVLHGEIVLFTSGSEDEIGISPAARELIEKASFVSHTHPGIHSTEGPSGQDLNEAKDEEYVLTHRGVYAYDASGLLTEEPFAYADYLKKIEEAKVNTAEKDQVEARKDLNAFIAAQDEYNQNEEVRETFRRGGTLAATVGLTSTSITTLPGSPRPYIATGSTAATTIAHNSGIFSLGYSVPSAGNVSGFTISFDNATTASVETQNISALANLTFGLKGPNTSVSLEIVDTNGNKDIWTLTGISNTTEQFWRLPIASIAGTVDKTKIKQLNFIVGQANTTTTTRTGTLAVRAAGLNVSVPAQPVVTSMGPASTNLTTLTLSGTKEAHTAILINGTQVVASNGDSTWTAAVSLTTEGNNTFNIITKSVLGLTSTNKTVTVLRDTAVPTGALSSINSGNLFTSSNSVTLALSAADGGSGIDKMSFSTNNSTWSNVENYAASKTFTVPNGDGAKTVYVKFYDKAGNVSAVYSKTITLDTSKPTGSININSGASYTSSGSVTLNLSATDTGSGMNTMSFSTDNAAWTTPENYAASKTFTLPAGDGNKTVYVKFMDKAGNVSSVYSKTIMLDAAAPSGLVTINSDKPVTASRTVTLNLLSADSASGLDKMRISLDGGTTWGSWENVASSKSVTLPDGLGLKTVRYELRDKAGLIASYSDTIQYISSSRTLSDGTQLFYTGDVLTRERTPLGDDIYFAADGRVDKYRYSNGDEIRYLTDGTISFVTTAGTEAIAAPTAPVLEETQAIKLTLQDGVEAYYVNGVPVEFRTQTGIRVTSFKLNAQNEIIDALILYPNNTREIMRKGKLLRRIGSDGSVMDFVPSGFSVREIVSGSTQYYDYDKTSQTAFTSLRIFTAAGEYSKYDNLGILREAGKTGTRYIYKRTDFAAEVETRLETALSSAVTAKTMVYGKYTLEGKVVQMKLQDGTDMKFDAAGLTEVLNGSGIRIADYVYDDPEAALKVVRKDTNNNNINFLYDRTGFLRAIKTADGSTIQRTAEDTDHDGMLTDEQSVELLLEEAGGNHLSDFQLDSQGRILNGILETKEGVKQRIENGVLTGFETVDGKVYGMRNTANGGREAYLQEWKFKDGTRIVYGGSNITEILFPDNRKLINIGFDSEKAIQEYTEVTSDSTKIYRAVAGAAGGEPVMRLAEMTKSGVRIIYGLDGMAQTVTLADGSLQKVSYERNAEGALQKITFEEEHGHRSYAPEGTLLELLSQGVNAEISDNKITKLFTRFGATTDDPAFDANGIVTGDFAFTDGTKLSVTNGQLVKAVRANGTTIHFAAGRMDKIEIPSGAANVPAKSFKLLYDDAAVNGEDRIRIRLESEPGQPEMPLVPFLQKPEALLEWLQGGSVPNHPVTFFGDAIIQNTNPKIGGGAVSMDGAGDYLTIDHDTAFEFGTGNWTLDTWVKFDQQSAEYAVFQMGNHLNGGIQINRHAGINRWDIFVGGNNVISVNTTIAAGTWAHIALVRDGNTIRFFQNGVQVATRNADNNAPVTNTGKIYLGQNSSNQQFLPGKLDELRLSSGARWNANFTPSSQEYENDASTRLLLHFDPPSEQAAAGSPAAAAQELASILLSRPLYNSLEDRFRVKSIFDIEEQTATSGVHELTMNGNARLDTSVKKTGEGSAAFDGAGDYMSVSHTPALELGDSDWTVDFWAEFDQQSSEYSLLRNGDHLNGGFQINRHAGINRWDIFVAGNKVISVNSTLQTGVWHHLALVRTGNRLKFFQNGVLLADIDATGSNVNYTGPLTMGSNAGLYHFLPGRIDELRISKGAARWTSNFTPPTAEYTRDEQTALLLHFNQAEWTARREILPQAEEPEGEDNGIEIFFAKRTLDLEREQTYEFATKYLPEWLNVSLSETGASGAWLEQGIQIESGDSLADLTSTLLDMDGDGLLDRVTAVASANYWWVQKNNGQSFEKAEKWTNVDISASWTLREAAGPHPIFYTDLADMNGDGRPDRIVSRLNDPVWKVQFNNGHGFDAPVNWGGQMQVLSFYTNEGKYALESRYNRYGGDIQDQQSALIDMDGDGRADRIVRPTPVEGANPLNHWFFQRNNGTGFDDAVTWTGVDWGFYPQNTGLYSWDVKAIGASMNWQYLPQNGPADLMTDVADLVDLNGDGRPDRVLLKNETAGNLNSAFDWYVQWNNGKGFDAPALFDNDVRIVPGFTMSNGQNNAAMGSALQVFDHINTTRELVVDLVDVTGDGKPDRVSMKARPNGAAQASWWVEVNTGETFLSAVEWTGIEGANGVETAIGQDNDLYHMNRGDFNSCLRVSPCSFTRSTDLRDLNGDQILDRVIYPTGGTKWKIQFGTGSGFLPAQEMEIEGLIADSEAVHSSRYDYLHVSLKAAANITPQNGLVRISIGDKPEPGAPAGNYQEWTVTALGNDWKDFYLPINKNQPDAASVKITFEAVGNDPDIPIYIDNMTFTSVRPPAQNDWLDRLLTEKAVLQDIHSERTQTLSQYLGFTEADNTVDLNWNHLLTAETLIQFNSAGEAQKVKTFEGSESTIVNGSVAQVRLSNNTVITYETPSPSTPNQSTQTTSNAEGTTETDLSYGKVRTVTTQDNKVLKYSYEFCGSGASALVCEGLAGGTEITVVFDQAEGVTERYVGERLISRLKADGIETLFRYDAQGMLIRSQIAYKGRTRESFEYGMTAEGLKTLLTEDGVLEEYDADGKIKFHTTAEGFRYEHQPVTAQKPVYSTVERPVLLENGQPLMINGIPFKVTFPSVKFVDCNPSTETCTQTHQITLTQQRAANQDIANYEKGGLESVLLADGTKISFDRLDRTETTNEQAGEKTVTVKLLDVSIFHADGSITIYKNGEPYSVISGSGKEISIRSENGLLVNGAESAVFHKNQAALLWTNLVLTNWNLYQLPDELAIQAQTTLDGKMVSRILAEGTRETYNAKGKIEQIFSPEGERLITYEYDAEDNPTRISYEGVRRRLEAADLRQRTEVAIKREEAIAYVAIRELVITETVEGEYRTIRDNLLQILKELEVQRQDILKVPLVGKGAEEIIGSVLGQLQNQVNLVNEALVSLSVQRIDALANLKSQVLAAKTQIETQTSQSLQELTTEVQKIQQSILKQEIVPLVYHWYRKLLGRDASQAEADRWVATANYTLQNFNLAALKQELNTSLEMTQRTQQVNDIKAAVKLALDQFLTMTNEQKWAFAQGLGIAAPTQLSTPFGGQDLSVSPAVTLTSTEITALKNWINQQTLHFGQSAFLSLEALLKTGNIPFSRVELAKNLILVDIFTGTLTPNEKGELVLSLYAMKTTAKKMGMTIHPLALNYEGLKALYDEACPTGADTCTFRMAAHINGNHFIIIKKVTGTEVSYIDPGIGAETSLEHLVMTKEEFLSAWIDSGIKNSGFGTVLTPRAPPAAVVKPSVIPGTASARVLTEKEQMQVRGAFFGFFKAIAKFFAKVFFYAVFSGMYLIAVFSDSVKNFLSDFQKLVLLDIDVAFDLLTFDFKNAWETYKDSFGLRLSVLSQALLLPFNATADILVQLGVSEKFAATIADAAQIAVGIMITPFVPPLGAFYISNGAAGILNRHFELSPTVQSIVNITVQAAAILAGGFNPNIAFDAALKSAVLYAGQEFAVVGVSALGNAIGLDPRITSLIGIPIRAGIGAGVDSVLTADHINPTSILAGIKNGLAAGAEKIGFNFSGNPINSIFGSLSSGDVLGSIEDSLGKDRLFDNILGVLKDAALSPFNAVSGAVSAAFNGFKDFSSLIQTKGLIGAFDSLATSIFSRKTLEAILKAGGMSGFLGSATQISTNFNGQQATEWKFNSTNETSVLSLFFNGSGTLIGKRENGTTQAGTFGSNSAGKWGLVTGTIMTLLAGGDVFAANIAEGQWLNGAVTRDNSIIASFHPEKNNKYIYIDGIKPNNPNSNGSFWDFILQIIPYGFNFDFKNNQLTQVDYTSSNITPAILDTRNVPLDREIDIALLNGFQIRANTVAEGMISNYFRQDGPFQQELNQNGMDISRVLAVPLFESGIIGQFASWTDWVKQGLIAQEIMREFDRIRNARGAIPFVPLAYSGSGEPLIKALSNDATGYGVKTAILVGVPTRTTEFVTTSLERVINIYGSKDDFLEERLGSAPVIGGVFPTIEKSFTNSVRSLDTINIELVGINHQQYFYENGQIPTALQHKANDFIAKLTQVSVNALDLELFLQSIGVPTLIQSNGINRTYKIDLSILSF